MKRADYPRRREIVSNRALLLNMLAAVHGWIEWFVDGCGICHIEELVGFLSNVRRHIANNYNSHYVGVSLDDMFQVSYSPKGVHRWDDARRKRLSLNRYIGRHSGISHDYLESYSLTLSNILRAMIIAKHSEVVLLSGDDFVQAYRDEVGGDSCMTGYAATCMELVSHNTSAQLAVLKFEGEYIARAILWTATDGTKILDRCYTNYSPESVVLKRWAQQMGYVYRNSDSCSDRSLSDGKQYKVRLECDPASHPAMPYIDTFRHLTKDEKGFVLSNHISDDTFFIFDSDSGEYDVTECCGCDCYIQTTDNDNVHDDNYYCDSCWDTMFEECEECGDMCPTEDVHTLEIRYNGRLQRSADICEVCYDRMQLEF